MLELLQIMANSIFLGLIYNASLLLAIFFVFEMMVSRLKRDNSFLWQVMTGMALGGIGLAIMETNWELVPGVIFDTRSVLLGIAGLYFGWIPTLIVMVMASSYRIYLGGSGVYMGVAVILEAGLIGLAWRHFREWCMCKISAKELYLFGLLIHLVMLALTLLLPSEIRGGVFLKIWLPVITIYPVATLMIGRLMTSKLSQDLIDKELRESIMERRKADEAIKMNLERYRILYDNTPTMNFTLDTSGKVLSLNRFAAKELGYRPDELMGKPIINIFYEKDKQKVTRQLEEILKNPQQIYEWELRKIHKNGRIIWVKETSHVTKDENGKLVILIVCQDITKRKKTEEKILELGERGEAILHSIGEGVFACDREGKILVFNKMAEKLTGVSMEEASGRHYREVINLVSEISGKPIADFIVRAMDSNKLVTMAKNVLLIRKDGNKFPVADSAAPVRNVHGAVAGCVVVFRDITEERSLDKAKTELISLASHQLRSPLTAIKWFTRMLRSKGKGTALTETQDKLASEIERANEKMITLVGSLLNVSRLEMGTFVVEPVLVDLAELTKSSVDHFRQLIQTKGLNIQEEYDSGLEDFAADPKLFGLVMQNLLSNAVKFTPSGGSISVSVKKEGGLIKITVADTGVGIPKYQREKIFTKLFRGDNVKTLDPSGTGLGLYIVKEIVDHSGGKVWFDSEEGKGTTFYVTFSMTGMTRQEERV